MHSVLNDEPCIQQQLHVQWKGSVTYTSRVHLTTVVRLNKTCGRWNWSYVVKIPVTIRSIL